DEEVVGYELFFREGPGQNRFTSDPERATSATIDALNMVGLDVLCDGHPAFINCSRQMLLTEYFALLPPNEVVVEIQETVAADEEVKEACKRLKRGGYSIALDNFVAGDDREALVPYADFIKVDIRTVTPEQSAILIALHGSEHCRMLAQKVETRDTFLVAKNNGFTRFRDISFVVPKFSKPGRFPPPKSPTCAC
ncbi:MAG: EAL domain-containing protein, partial [Terriglobales bacterium]